MIWSAPPQEYSELGRLLDSGGTPADVADWLIALWSSRSDDPSSVTVFEHGDAEFVFELPSEELGKTPRTLGALGFATEPPRSRDSHYQQNFPLPTLAGRPTDRGHLIPHSAAGLYGPNLYRQDRALNRGLSGDGREYRRIESRAVNTHSFMFCALRYVDDSDYPAVVELGCLVEGKLDIGVFRNRFDEATLAAFPLPNDHREADAMRLRYLPSLEIDQIGDAVARALTLDSTDKVAEFLVGIGDAAVLAGAVHVETRYQKSTAGKLTRAGNLRRPQLRSTSGLIAVCVVDLRSALAQWFPVLPSGKVASPGEGPLDCSAQVDLALRGSSISGTFAPSGASHWKT